MGFQKINMRSRSEKVDFFLGFFSDSCTETLEKVQKTYLHKIFALKFMNSLKQDKKCIFPQEIAKTICLKGAGTQFTRKVSHRRYF